ncbi:MAG: major facilitator superfamily domain-containing protein 7 [bacterium]|nr:major facilitator superfamily domain-containing protein 7 [bacterium]
MVKSEIKVYGYRWVVLLVFAIINVVIQLQWITFAPIAKAAQTVYGVSPLQIDFLSMVFMLMYLVVCIPASYIIDTYGIRIGLGIGAVLAGIFGLMKGVFGGDYMMVCIAQTGLAVAQPFILNSITKVGIRWFPINERATVAGVSALAQYIGIIAAMIVTPYLITRDAAGGYDISNMLMIYGVITVAGAILVLVFIRERPATPPHLEGEDERITVFAGIKHIFKHRDMLILLLMFFIGLGMFNAISTCIDQICKLRGLDFEQSGMVGGVMLIGGVVGACIIPPLSDKFRRRKLFFLICITCMTPGLVGLTFFQSYTLMLASSFVLGFFFMSAGPIGFQYSAEISAPAPESTSQGLILLAGQLSGAIFIFGMNSLGMIPFMKFYIALAAVNIVLAILIRESTMIGNKPTAAGK